MAGPSAYLCLGCYCYDYGGCWFVDFLLVLVLLGRWMVKRKETQATQRLRQDIAYPSPCLGQTNRVAGGGQVKGFRPPPPQLDNNKNKEKKEQQQKRGGGRVFLVGLTCGFYCVFSRNLMERITACLGWGEDRTSNTPPPPPPYNKC